MTLFFQRVLESAWELYSYPQRQDRRIFAGEADAILFVSLTWNSKSPTR